MEISALIRIQKQHFSSGVTLDYRFRLLALKRLLAAISRMEGEIADALYADLGKSAAESYITETGTVKAELKHAIRHLGGWMKNKRIKTPIAAFPARCYSVAEPYGAVLIMSPWNYPFLLAVAPLIGAIAAGNCAIIKPSAYAPATADLIHQLISRCFPPEFCAVVRGSRRENTALLQQKFDYIFFTGSPAVGRTVMAAAARHLTPVTLELGGKSPAIVDETANIDLAARRLVFGKYLNAGQTCVAPDYVLVHHSKKRELIKKLRNYIRLFYPKDAAGAVADYPRIVNEKHFLRLCALMENESVAIGGKTMAEGLSIEPTVLVDVSPDAPIMQEEIFGPLLPVIEYARLDAAIDFIKQRPKPLALYIFSADKPAISKVEKTLSYGGGCVNDCLLHVSSPHLPFGGVGESGMGSYHGKASFDTFSHRKTILNKNAKIDFALRYRPYDEKKMRLLRGI